jgi:hypothetical protein
MDRDPLSFFQPFENLPPGHENQLTRALLLVLRLCPIAHEAWLSRLSGHSGDCGRCCTRRSDWKLGSTAGGRASTLIIFRA